MIVVVDYGMGNLRSVQKAFEKVGFEAVVSGRPEDVAEAERIVVPGVGAFEAAREALRQNQLDTAIGDAVAEGKPFLGICLGLQLLFTTSYEDGVHEGLGIVPGEVVKFDATAGLRVPHMGWNGVRFERSCPVFEGIADDTHFYFVHSYYVAPRDEAVALTHTNYGIDFVSSIWRDNVVATQFHPEKSQAVGLKVLQNFARWRP